MDGFKKLGMLEVERENKAMRDFNDIDTEPNCSKDDNGSADENERKQTMKEMIARRLEEDEQL